MAAVALCSLLLLSGCLTSQQDVEVPDVVLPEGWSTITARTVANPHLNGFNDCASLEDALKLSLIHI